MEKEKMIEEATRILNQLYYEDAEFFCRMIKKFSEKKTVEVTP